MDSKLVKALTVGAIAGAAVTMAHAQHGAAVVLSAKCHEQTSHTRLPHRDAIRLSLPQAEVLDCSRQRL
jgi:hypothetical protein